MADLPKTCCCGNVLVARVAYAHPIGLETRWASVGLTDRGSFSCCEKDVSPAAHTAIQTTKHLLTVLCTGLSWGALSLPTVTLAPATATWRRFWERNVYPRRTETGVAVLALFALLEQREGRKGAWHSIRELVETWQDIDTDRGRLEDPRLGTPFGDGIWQVTVQSLTFGRGRICIDDGVMTVAEFW